MKKLIMNLITFTPFIFSMILFKIRTTTPDIVYSNGKTVEQGFGYSAAGAILCLLGIIMICVRLGLYFYKKIKKTRYIV